MSVARRSLFWRVFAVNAVLLVSFTVMLFATPVTVSERIRLIEAAVLAVGLAVTLGVNFVLLRRVFDPLEGLARRMETVDLLQPGRRLPAGSDEVGRLIAAFNRMLDRLQNERRESGRRAVAAQEAERRRIARGLHDEVGQVLTGVLLQLDAMGGSATPEQQAELEETRRFVRQALEEVRRISRELRPEMLDDLGLVSALTELTTTFGRLAGVAVERSFAADLPPLSEEAELVVYRVAQESLTNVARHAAAATVWVALERAPPGVRLRVEDDGRGFDERGPTEQGGLRGMREHALLLGAELAIERGRRGGVEVRLDVELPARAPEPR